MSTLDHNVDLQEKICYVQCSYCTTILLVSVPCSSLSVVVTVKCGHCTSLLSVNMAKASFTPLHLLASLTQSNHHDHEINKKETPPEVIKDSEKEMGKHSSSSPVASSSDEEEDYHVPMNLIINKPPEKRQRAPSAYNCFIKEEIRRLKAKNPNMAHKQAFSTAAKNWSHCPPSQGTNGEEESCSQEPKQIQTK